MHIGFVLGQSRTRIRKLRACLFQLQLERLGIDFGDELALFNRGVEVCVDRDDGAGYVASKLDRDHRVQRAGGGNGANSAPRVTSATTYFAGSEVPRTRYSTPAISASSAAIRTPVLSETESPRNRVPR